VQKCKVTLKKFERLPAARNSHRVVNLRNAKVEDWEATPDLDFCKNCVFIDEAWFNLHTQRNYGCSRKGTSAKGTVPTAKGITIAILGAISQAALIDISLKEPQAVAIAKKSKENDAKVMVLSGRLGNKKRAFSRLYLKCNGYAG
jgi:hypothetical protein